MTRPLLPCVEKIFPYLKRMDSTRVYSNFGGLNAEYQDRLGGLFGAPCVTGSSATSLITATLMAYNLPKGSFVAMPSWTFPATAAAVVSAGLVPYFMDVNKEGFLHGDMEWGRYKPIQQRPKVVLVVSPFGAPLPDIEGLEEAAEREEVRLVIDAAAGFDAFSTVCKPRKCPVIVSTHATKAFGTGEGGFVTCHDTPLLERIRRITNFGLTPERRIEYNGLNAKFSEYHAAVGLASLDAWPEKRKFLLEAVKPYGLSYAVTQVAVRGKGLMGRYGCHVHDAYKDYPSTDLPVTEELIANVGAVYV